MKCSELSELPQVVAGSAKHHKLGGQEGKSYAEHLADGQNSQIVTPQWSHKKIEGWIDCQPYDRVQRPYQKESELSLMPIDEA